jgi:hypothetical protein
MHRAIPGELGKPLRIRQIEVVGDATNSVLFHRAGHPRAGISMGAACNLSTLSAILCWFESAGVAQLVEHLICNQRVGGSIPSASSTG